MAGCRKVPALVELENRASLGVLSDGSQAKVGSGNAVLRGGLRRGRLGLVAVGRRIGRPEMTSTFRADPELIRRPGHVGSGVAHVHLRAATHTPDVDTNVGHAEDSSASGARSVETPEIALTYPPQRTRIFIFRLDNYPITQLPNYPIR